MDRPVDAHEPMASSRMTETGSRASVLDSLGRPHLVFLGICMVYLTFPSNHFNADALHYNLMGLHSAVDPSVFFNDVAVPVHFAWHAMATVLIRLSGTQSPMQSLYILEIFTIVTALASIFVFMKLLRSFADDFVTVCATIVLAFSHACLMFFLSVEVYALNNLVLTLTMGFIHRYCVRPPAGLGGGPTLVLALLTALSVATHLSNLMLLPTVSLFLIAAHPRRAWIRLAVYLPATGVLLCLLLLGLATSRSMTVVETLRSLAGSSETEHFVSGGPVQNAARFLQSASEAALGRFGPALYLPLAAAALFVLRNARALWVHPFFRFLLIYLVMSVGFASQWDSANMEHKIAILPIVLVLIAYAHAVVSRRMPSWGKATAAAVAAAFVALGFLQAILPHRNLDSYDLYRLSATIHEATDADQVLVVGLASEVGGHAVVMASPTFFGQSVRVLHPDDSGYVDKLRRYREQGYAVVRYDGGEVRAMGAPGEWVERR